MKILVTGATGKVGCRLSRRLAQRGDHLRALVRDPARAADLQTDRVELVPASSVPILEGEHAYRPVAMTDVELFTIYSPK